MNLKTIVERRPLTSYFLLAYGITWGGILCLLFVNDFIFANMALTQNVMIMFLLMILGPSMSSLFLHQYLQGRSGLGELWSRQKTWKIGLGWYAIALLTVPILAFGIFSFLSLIVDPVYEARFQPAGLGIGLIAGFIEEIGWTGFATPRLLKKYSVLKAGIILGLMWALWHMMADFSGNISTMGWGWLASFLLFWLLPLTAYRVLMTWVFSNTNSLFLAQLMHASYTGWLLTLSPQTSFNQGLVWQAILAASLWGLVGIISILLGREQETICGLN